MIALRYLRDPQLQRNGHCFQTRVEVYHQLRSVIAQIGGKHHLIGNECGRLLVAHYTLGGNPHPMDRRSMPASFYTLTC